jgi:hypothetical protein
MSTRSVVGMWIRNHSTAMRWIGREKRDWVAIFDLIYCAVFVKLPPFYEHESKLNPYTIES